MLQIYSLISISYYLFFKFLITINMTNVTQPKAAPLLGLERLHVSAWCVSFKKPSARVAEGRR